MGRRMLKSRSSNCKDKARSPARPGSVLPFVPAGATSVCCATLGSRRASLCYIVLNYIILYYTIFYHILLYYLYILSYHIILSYIITEERPLASGETGGEDRLSAPSLALGEPGHDRPALTK